MNPRPSASALLLAAALAAAAGAGATAARAKSSDRNQPMYLDSDHQEGSVDGAGVNVWTGNVVVRQGTLDIRAQRAELHQRNGDPVRAVFTGKQVTLKQEMDDGTPVEMTADRVDYDLTSETVTLIGNYTVKSPRGSSNGQRLVYNLQSGNIQSGGDGSRVRTVIQPRSGGTQQPGNPPAKNTPARDAR